jgi:hypothetical protein
MILHLLVALHEHEGTIRRETRFSLLVNQPALVFGVFDLAVIGTDSLKLQLNVALVRSANIEASFLECRLKKDLVLDHVAVLISRNPGRAGSKNSLIISLVVTVGASHDNILLIALSNGFQFMSQLVDMIVHDFSKVDQGSLMELEGGVGGDLQTGGVNYTKITNVEASVFTENHELGLPELLVICNDVVVAVTFTHFVLG